MWTKDEVLATIEREKTERACYGDCAPKSELPPRVFGYYATGFGAMLEKSRLRRQQLEELLAQPRVLKRPPAWRAAAAAPEPAALDEPAEEFDEEFDEEQFLETCRHEVAHATCVLHFGGLVGSLEAHGAGGTCRHSRLSPQQSAVVCAAGIAAMHTKPQFHFADSVVRGDRAQFLESMREAGAIGTDDQVMDLFHHSEESADYILGQHWQFRRACVNALAAKGVLDQDEIEELWNRYER